MEFHKTSHVFDEVKIYKGKIFEDNRGFFSKPFYGELISKEFSHSYEVLISKSKKNVIRGLHFQTPPHSVSKIVYCVDGSIKDVFIDLRKGSSTYGMFDHVYLDSVEPLSVFIPEGFGHGFSVLSDTATVLYLQSGEFNEESDSGIYYDSAGIDWEIQNPIISEKDSQLIKLNNFESHWV